MTYGHMNCSSHIIHLEPFLCFQKIITVRWLFCHFNVLINFSIYHYKFKEDEVIIMIFNCSQTWIFPIDCSKMEGTTSSSTRRAATLRLRGMSCEDNSVIMKHWIATYNEWSIIFGWRDLETIWCRTSWMIPTWKAVRQTEQMWSFFMPMCAKAEDMWMLHELGFTVVAVEIVHHYIQSTPLHTRLLQRA